MNKTALYDEHIRLGGKMISFAGWEMPVQFEGIRPEHLRVRSSVGLFDVSHMGEIEVRGPKSLDTLQWLTSNDVAKLDVGQAQYSLLTNEKGGVVDDLIVYCIEPENNYLLCVNAANIEKDWAHINRHNRGATLENTSHLWSQIAVQGPKSFALLTPIFGDLIQELKSFHFAPFHWAGAEVIVARTGYTGEPGVEIFVRNDVASALWRDLLEQGAEWGVAPIGLGARDTLRLEMKYPLYGQDITDETNPYTAGLGWVVKPKAKDFLGAGPMLAAKEKGLEAKLVGLKIQDRGIARSQYGVMDQAGAFIGRVTSGGPSPSLGENIAMAYVKNEYSTPGSEIWVDIRGRAVKATVVETPFVKV